MGRRIQSLGMVCVFAGVSVWGPAAFAQLRSEKNASILNYLGRFHGVGYSDGYHANSNSTSSNSARPGDRVGNWTGAGASQLYGTPSTIETTRARPTFGVQDRWVGVGLSQPTGHTYPVQSSFAPYSTPAPIPSPAPASRVAPPPNRPEALPTESLLRESLPSPSDINPRVKRPSGLLNESSGGPVGYTPSRYPGDNPSGYPGGNGYPGGTRGVGQATSRSEHGKVQATYPQSELAPQFIIPPSS